jgi:dipeptidyl aminopeptidase/acylaminoacyl peptidase
MKLNVCLLDDLEKYSDTKLNIKKAAKENNKPWLIIHGSEDLAVKIHEAELLYQWANKSTTEIVIIHNTGHTFNASHPFEASNPKLDLVLEKTDMFFNKSVI